MDFSLSNSLSNSGSQSPQVSTYQTAARLFVNRNFSQSYETLLPLIDNDQNYPVRDVSTSIKAWTLYLALLDASQKHQESWSKPRSKELLMLISTEEIWSKAETMFGEPKVMPPAILIGLAGLSSKYANGQDLHAALDKVERHLKLLEAEVANATSIDEFTPQFLLNYQKLFSIYVLQFLGRMKELETARQVVEVNPILPDNKKDELLISIKDLTDTDKHVSNKHSMDAVISENDHEVSNVTTMSNSHSSSSSISTLSEYSDSTNISDLSPANPVPIDPLQLQGSNGDTNNNVTPSTFNRIVNHWKLKLSQAYTRRSLSSVSVIFPLIAFILAFLLSFSRVRRRLRSEISRVWQAVIRTLAMGMKVSYL